MTEEGIYLFLFPSGFTFFSLSLSLSLSLSRFTHAWFFIPPLSHPPPLFVEEECTQCAWSVETRRLFVR